MSPEPLRRYRPAPTLTRWHKALIFVLVAAAIVAASIGAGGILGRPHHGATTRVYGAT